MAILERTAADKHALAHMILACAAMLFAIGFAVLVVWMIVSEPKTKLYEADNVVCSIGPLVQDCFERKPR